MNSVFYFYTGSGKTVFTRRLLENKEKLFTSPSPRAAVLFYKQWQSDYSALQKSGIVNEFVLGIPSEEEVKAIFMKYKKYGGCIAIFDDLMGEINDTMMSIYTVLSHHCKATVITLVQSLFLENKIYRTCSINAHYIVLMRSPRDSVSCTYLARQISPYHSKYITESYMKATQTPYSYLLFDLRQETSDMVRLRSNIFSTPISIYVESNIKKKK